MKNTKKKTRLEHLKNYCFNKRVRLAAVTCFETCLAAMQYYSIKVGYILPPIEMFIRVMESRSHHGAYSKL